jgi:tetratricopeptide (TPR) repeat protein
MTLLGRRALAFCTLLCVAVSLHAGTAHAGQREANIAAYERAQVQWGATVLLLPAQLEYRTALAKERTGDRDAALVHLERATELAPNWPDPHFTIAGIKFRSFDPDALYYLVGGVKALWLDFHSQSLLLTNLLIIGLLVLVVAATIFCIAFAVRYLPFVAYRLSEVLEKRASAVMARPAAYLLLLVPFALLPGFVTGFCFLMLLTWHFMQRRERIVMVLLALPFIALGLLAGHVERYTPVANPSSFTALVSQGVSSAGNNTLLRQIESARSENLTIEKNIAMGIIYQRQENFDAAASLFLEAISMEPDNAMAYINLGNVYYLQGRYEKALEGYRKAEQLLPTDAVGQYNLAQAYIKTLLMAESSDALRASAAAGIDRVKDSYAKPAQPGLLVYAKTYQPRDLWRIAGVEGTSLPPTLIDDVLAPVTRFDGRTGAWIMLATLIIVLILAHFIKRQHLAFQCSNCGELTSEATANSERGMYICRDCAGVIGGVSSEKVIEALMRQRRQKVLVRRRRAIRFLTTWVPGVRDVFYGRITRGLFLAFVVGLSAVQLWSRGYVIKDWYMLELPTPVWKWALPAAGIVIAYAMTLLSRQYKEVRNYRNTSLRARSAARETSTARRASA